MRRAVRPRDPERPSGRCRPRAPRRRLPSSQDRARPDAPSGVSKSFILCDAIRHECYVRDAIEEVPILKGNGIRSDEHTQSDSEDRVALLEKKQVADAKIHSEQSCQKEPHEGAIYCVHEDPPFRDWPQRYSVEPEP